MNFIEPDTLPDELRNSITYRNLKEGERLFRQGDTGHDLYAIASGRIKLIHHLDSGKSITLQFLDSEKLLGEDALHERIYAYTAISQIPTRVVIYPQDILQAVLSSNPLLATQLRNLLIARIRACYQIIKLRGIKAAPQRILQYLRDLAVDNLNNPQTEIIFQKSFKEIAAELDFTPETVSRTLVQLEKVGMITRRKNYIALKESNFK